MRKIRLNQFKSKRGRLIIYWLTIVSILLGSSAHADIVVVANADVPVEELSWQDVKQIFLGRSHVYPDSRTAIKAYDYPEANDIYAAFYTRVVDIDLHRLKRYRARSLFSGQGRIPEKVKDKTEMLKYLKENPNAIGYVEGVFDMAGLKVVYHQPEAVSDELEQVE